MGNVDRMNVTNFPREARGAVRWRGHGTAVSALLIAFAVSGAAQDTALKLDPALTSVKFTLGDVLHTVRGKFQLKRGSLEFEPASGRLSGDVVVDAGSGDSGSGMRDRKMNKEVLESNRYPEIVFHPDRIEGAVASQGKSSVRVHGMFNIHGVDHEITVPAAVEMSADHWTATVHFTVPYAKWGMKNPSTLFLKVNDSVEIDLMASGNVVRPSIANSAH
jgi:polyisoprenoid-binding protein YceI